MAVMLRTIQFYDKIRFSAVKVNNKVINNFLP